MSRVPNGCNRIFMIFQLNLDQFNLVCAEFARAFVTINHYVGMLKFWWFYETLDLCFFRSYFWMWAHTHLVMLSLINGTLKWDWRPQLICDLLKSINEHFQLDYVRMGGIRNIELILALFLETHKYAKVSAKRTAHIDWTIDRLLYERDNQ